MQFKASLPSLTPFYPTPPLPFYLYLPLPVPFASILPAIFNISLSLPTQVSDLPCPLLGPHLLFGHHPLALAHCHLLFSPVPIPPITCAPLLPAPPCLVPPLAPFYTPPLPALPRTNVAHPNAAPTARCLPPALFSPYCHLPYLDWFVF